MTWFNSPVAVIIFTDNSEGVFKFNSIRISPLDGFGLILKSVSSYLDAIKYHNRIEVTNFSLKTFGDYYERSVETEKISG